MKRPRARFVQLWIALSLLCVGSMLIVVLAVGAALAPDDRAAALALLSGASALPYLVLLILVGSLGFLAAWIDKRYFVAFGAIANATAVAAIGNPSHRLPPAEAAELQRLVEAINALAERHEQALSRVDARVDEARRALEAERNRLAVLMGELPQGVVVCNAQGAVLLYNEQARPLLCPPQGRVFLGLGRSLHGVIGDAAFARALADLVARDAAGEIDPVVELDLSVAERPLRIRIAPVAGSAGTPDSAGAPQGFVLVIEGARASAPLPAEGERLARRSRPAPAARPVFYDFDLFHRHAPAAAVEDCRLQDLAYTVMDTETTGLDPAAGDEIISIGAVRILNGRIVPEDTFDCLIDPARPVDPRSTRIHGLTDALLRGQPAISDVLPRFHAFCADTVLVGHNLAFDLRFLQLKERATGVGFRQPVLDTLLLAAALDEHSGDDRLEAIAHRFGIEVLARHTALGDALITAQVFLKMLPLLAARGIGTLRQAQEASLRTPYAHIRY